MYKKIKFAEAIKDWVGLEVKSGNIIEDINDIGIDGLTARLYEATSLIFTNPNERDVLTIRRSFFNAGKFSLNVGEHNIFRGETSDPNVVKFFQSIAINPRVIDYLHAGLMLNGDITWHELILSSPVSFDIEYAYKEHKSDYNHGDLDVNTEMELDLKFKNKRMLKCYEMFGSNQSMTWKLLDFSKEREGDLTVYESRERYNPLIGAMFLAGID